MTKDLAISVHGTTKVTTNQYVNTTAFMDEVKLRLDKRFEAASR